MISAFQKIPRSVLLPGLTLVWLWFRLLDHLRLEWTVNEQYAYGWAVPFLCAYLLWRRWRIDAPATGHRRTDAPFTGPVVQWSCGLVVLLFVFTRWIEVANPDWRLVSWALALEVIAFTLLMLRLFLGATVARHLAFPILFLLVAVPWPTVIEQPIIQTLTRGIVAVTVELLNAFGIAAVPHGNVIETAGGLVDIDEACSGIRSLQAVLMLALFFGELSRFSAKRRGALCLVAFALAAVFNLARTLTLSFVASQRGPAAVESWHDPAGIAILVGCFIGVWAVAAWMGRAKRGDKGTAGQGEGENETRNAEHGTRNTFLHPVSLSPRLQVGLLGLLLAGELAVHFWYASAAPAPTPDWTATFPTNNPSFNAAEIPSSAEKILRFNEGRSGTWLHPDGTRWQMIYLRWLPGRVATTLARNHTPEICLPAAGRNLRGMSNIAGLEAGGVSLPFRSFTTGPEGRPLFVFYTLWEDGAREQRNATQLLTRSARFRAVLERRRNPGQRVLQIAIWGARDEAHAVELLRGELGQLIQQNAETPKR